MRIYFIVSVWASTVKRLYDSEYLIDIPPVAEYTKIVCPALFRERYNAHYYGEKTKTEDGST